MNHYVMNQYFNRGGRHYWIAEQLKQDLWCAVCSDPLHSL